MKKNLFFTNNLFVKQADIINILGITTLWIVMIFLVNPVGNFPLNDDWVYGRAVRSIVEKGVFNLSEGHSTPNLFAQAYWGALFCLPFGFSFTALRFSTLILGAIGVIATYGLLREVKASQSISLLGALLIALNPIYFGLSNTFMTDVPFFTLATLSLYFLILGFQYNSYFKLIIGLFLSYVSLLIRQLGLIISLALGGAYLVKKGLSVKTFFLSLVPISLGIALQFLYQAWLKATNRQSEILGMQVDITIKTLFSGDLNLINYFSYNLLIALIYLGLFSAPLVIILFVNNLKKKSIQGKKIIFFGVFFIAALITSRLMLGERQRMPLSKNILTEFGLGPLTLCDTYILKLNSPSIPLIVKFFWIVLTILGIACSALLAYYFVMAILQVIKTSKKLKISQKNWLKIFILLALSIYFLPLGIQGYFDRYLLLMLPLLMIGIIISNIGVGKVNLSSRAITLLLAIMLVYGGLTVGATHDYLLWNRVRWQALNTLLQEDKISPNFIDGGYEFNGWYLFDPEYKPQTDRSLWVNKNDYMISFGAVSGYEKLRQYSLKRWLPIGVENIFVLHKKIAS